MKLLSLSRALKTRDERRATISGDPGAVGTGSGTTVGLGCANVSLSVKKGLGTRNAGDANEHKAAFSGDGHKAILSFSCSQGKR